jgi:hypothetical protein
MTNTDALTVVPKVWNLLAPGPSASITLAESLQGIPLGVVNNAYQLAPWADFLAATDLHWWRKYPQALDFAGRKFSCHTVFGTERVRIEVVNSGVLGLECARRMGATEIHLYGFDMHGSHFFGPYANGLKNTAPEKRKLHRDQFKQWGRRYRKTVRVINYTPGSALTCFEYAEDILRQQGQPESIRAAGLC